MALEYIVKSPNTNEIAHTVHNAHVIANSIKESDTQVYPGRLKVYYSDDESLLDAVWHAKRLGLIHTDTTLISMWTGIKKA